MSTPYIGQLLLVSFGRGITNLYVPCNGQTMQISSNQALFSLLGTAFGGNGVSTFCLPNLQGRTPVGVGDNITWGQVSGEEAHTLKANEVPSHTHSLNAVTGKTTTIKPAGALIASGAAAAYTGPANLASMQPGTLSNAGSSGPHENRQPFLTMNWLIAVKGIFPTKP